MMKIPLNHGCEALVDDEDYDLVKRFDWKAARKKDGRFIPRYADLSNGWRKRRWVFMAPAILGHPRGTKVYYLDGDALNNTRANMVPGIDFHKCHEPDPATGCWEWLRSRQWQGYGRVNFRGEQWLAHRVSYILHNHFEIPPGLIVMHSCDNPACVNPAHLSLGTLSDNSKDMAAKGRSGLPPSKLTPEEVLIIRADDRARRIIAAEYGVCKSTVDHIKSGRSWTGVAL